MPLPKPFTSERRIAQGLFVAVLITFFAAEHARKLLDSQSTAAPVATPARTAPGAAAQPVALR
ncbi:MAG: hypothetical protein EOO11_19390 [Chitinophagaceae bacterium]|nr:MAG: hypothetical protein EOO11_19390 [Chitinophagaceae bacterium]